MNTDAAESSFGNSADYLIEFGGKKNSLPKLISVFLIGYILSLSFLEVFDFPIVGAKVQPPELFFLVILGLAVIDIFRSKTKTSNSGIPLLSWKAFYTQFFKTPAILLYATAVLLSALFHGQLKPWLEFFGLIYLIILFLIFQKYYWILSPKRVFKYLIISGLIAAALGAAGWILAQFDVQTPLSLSKASYYAYFGYIGRAKAFTMNPNMLMSITAICFLLKFSETIFKKKSSKTDWTVLFILALGGLLTFSKCLVALAIGVIFIWVKRQDFKGFQKNSFLNSPFNRYVKSLLISVAFFLFLFYNFGSHIVVSGKKEINWEILKAKAYTEEQPFFETKEYFFIWANYAVNKKSATLAGIRNPIFGVGPGGHNQFVAELKKEGKYPNYFTNYDPHCTYFGAFGEMGILGFSALMYLCWVIFKRLRRLLKVGNHPLQFLTVGLAGCFIYFSVEAITTDIMNFRHFWVLLAILFSMSEPTTDN